jgi:glycosyltransferase involved in cell wall biosynthesis
MVRVLCFGVSLVLGGVSKTVIEYYKRFNHQRIVFDFEILADVEPLFENVVASTGSKIYTNCRLRDGVLRNIVNKYKHLRTEHYDAIYSHNGFKALPELLLATILGVKKRIVHSHTANESETFARWILRKILSFLVSIVATDLFACSHEAGLWAFGKRACGSEKFRIVRNAIDLDAFGFDKDRRDRIRATLGVQGKLVIGCIGRFSFEKNHDFLIEIFRELKDQRNDCVLMLVGDGELLTDIRCKVQRYGLENSVIFLGAQESVHDWVQAMDVFVLPSLYEGFGTVFLEAQAVGIRCYGSKERVPEAVKLSALMSFVSLSESPKAWADRILADHRMSEERIDVRDELVHAGYDINIEAPKLEELFLAGK